jgi:hypothetical protein
VTGVNFKAPPRIQRPGLNQRPMSGILPVILNHSVNRVCAIATRIVVLAGLISLTAAGMAKGPEAALERQFEAKIKPFVANYCLSCHGHEKPKGDLDLSPYTTLAAVARDTAHWEMALERMESNEMPPKKADKHPSANERKEVIQWIHALRKFEADKNAGDPGPVLARRLSNAEYDYTIRDLTGVDLRPTREFPVDPANQAGFDNSGESLTMSPALLKKYLQAAKEVSEHAVLTPDGIRFAPIPNSHDHGDRSRQVLHLSHRRLLPAPTDRLRGLFRRGMEI